MVINNNDLKNLTNNTMVLAQCMMKAPYMFGQSSWVSPPIWGESTSFGGNQNFLPPPLKTFLAYIINF